jgi:hypothetical protein
MDVNTLAFKIVQQSIGELPIKKEKARYGPTWTETGCCADS